MLRNFFNLVADAPDIIYACLGPNTSGDNAKDYVVLRALRSIIALSIWLIYYPIVALNLTYGVFVLDYALRVRYGDGMELTSPADTNVIIAGGITLLSFGLVKRFGHDLPPPLGPCIMRTRQVLSLPLSHGVSKGWLRGSPT